ncbi:zinc-binding dehydrogenase [Streptosporangium sp. NPDC023963]|uniref:zinc-binding dehydrogenase n=1 Tax=Streptosporangium sp. NPDC023963 TaxID=3155608 RepID=UPI0034201590
MEPVDYGRGLPVRIRALTAAPIDRALDVAGAGSLSELIELTGTADSVVTLADFGASTYGARLSTGRLGGRPDGVHGLASATALADRGRFRVPVRAAYPAHQAAQAHETAAQPPRRGKVVLDLTHTG